MPSDSRLYASQVVENWAIPQRYTDARCGEQVTWSIADECEVLVDKLLAGTGPQTEVVLKCKDSVEAAAANTYFKARLRARTMLLCQGSA